MRAPLPVQSYFLRRNLNRYTTMPLHPKLKGMSKLLPLIQRKRSKAKREEDRESQSFAMSHRGRRGAVDRCLRLEFGAVVRRAIHRRRTVRRSDLFCAMDA